MLVGRQEIDLPNVLAFDLPKLVFRLFCLFALFAPFYFIKIEVASEQQADDQQYSVPLKRIYLLRRFQTTAIPVISAIPGRTKMVNSRNIAIWL